MPYNGSQAPTPIHEEQRLLALQSQLILDTPPESAFDTLCGLAAHALGAPVACMGLLDADRLWFKARQGLSVAALARRDAICAHTIVQPDGLLLIEDLQAERRFGGHSLCAAPHGLRAYAGAALIDERGHALGTLAVMDTQARAFAPAQARALKDLASLVMVALQNRQRGLQLTHLALTDALTGLGNRAHFQQALDAELAHAMRTGEPFTVLCMDLDGFNDVRDGFGQLAADEVLVEVARRLNQQVRLGDVLAHFSGDEFGVVMRHGAKDSAQVLAKRIVKAVSAPITLASGDTIGVGISVGMAAYTDAIDSTGTLLAQADQALYQAKKQNEKRWKMFVGIR